jgi:hypothetical protein
MHTRRLANAIDTVAAVIALSALGMSGCSPKEGRSSDTAQAAAASTGAAKHLYVWAGPSMPTSGGAMKHDAMPAGENFVTVFDADSASATYGRAIASGTADVPGVMAHHTEYTLPTGRAMFANDYGAGKVFLLDVSNPATPRIVQRIDSVPGFRKPHSFARLPNGNVIASLQFGNGKTPGDPGGLGEFDPAGRLIRTSSSVDSAFPGARIRTYGVELLPLIDRIVTTSAPMDTETTAHVMQVWRMSDLRLLKTIVAPPIPGDSLYYYPFEVRALEDGRSALVNTYYCGFYLLTGLDTPTPTVTLVHTMREPRRIGCAVPTRIGHFWVMPIAYAHLIVTLDISNPARPTQVSELTTDTTFLPHWSSADPGSDRVVIVGQDDGEPRLFVVHVDRTTGRLTWDEKFRDDSTSRGVSFAKPSWPHGTAARVMPHGAVFGR